MKFKLIRFSVDAALLRELGERLVGRPHIALAELVKNSYDADATSCRFVFADDASEVQDNGLGMDKEDFTRFWMRIGTKHKQRETITRRLHRPVTGSKGIGRLAVQFLSNKLELWTATKRRGPVLHVKVDWSEALHKDSLVEAGARYRLENRKVDWVANSGGTRIRLENLNQEWDSQNIKDLAREIWVLQPPAEFLDDEERSTENFKIDVEGLPEEELKIFRDQMSAAIENWDAVIEGRVENGRNSGRAYVNVEFRDGETFEESFSIPNRALDRVRFSIRVFKLAGHQPKGISVTDAREYLRKFGGVRVYDAGFRLPYYGIEQDWLGLEIDHSHRLMLSKLLPEELRIPGGMQELPTQSRLFGVVRVNTGREEKKAGARVVRSGDYLKIQVTRDRLVDNKAYQDLRHVIRWSIDFYATKARIRRLREAQGAEGSGPALRESVSRLKTALLENRSRIPKKVYQVLETEVESVEHAQARRERAARSEQMLLGALATAGMAAIAIEHEVGKQMSSLRVHIDQLRDMSSTLGNDDLKVLADKLDGWVQRVSDARKMFSPLMSEGDRQTYAKLRAKHVVGRVAENMHSLMRDAQIDLSGIPESLRLPEGTMAGWQAIFQNLFTNAVTAMLDSSDRRIRCTGGISRRQGFVVVEDTGVGVDLETSEDLFKPFVRKLEISPSRQALGLGGTGLGLTIVKIVAETMGCSVVFVEPTAPFKTAVKMSWSMRDE